VLLAVDVMAKLGLYFEVGIPHQEAFIEGEKGEQVANSI